MSDVINKINKEAEGRMKKSLEAIKHGIEKIRTGRANPALLENITVEYYGSRTPLSQVVGLSECTAVVSAAACARPAASASARWRRSSSSCR